MWVKFPFGYILFTLLAMSTSNAEEVQTLNGETISNTLKCEAAKFAAYTKNRSIPGEKLKIKVSINIEDQNKLTGKAEAGISSIFRYIKTPSLTADAEKILSSIISIDGITYNIDQKNIVNCKKYNRIKSGLGIFSCLINGRALYFDAVSGGGTFGCASSQTITSTFSSSGKIEGFGLSFGPSTSTNYSSTLKVTVSAPPASK